MQMGNNAAVVDFAHAATGRTEMPFRSHELAQPFASTRSAAAAGELAGVAGALRDKLAPPITTDFAPAPRFAAADLAAHAARLFDTHRYLCRLFPFRADRDRAAADLAQLDVSAQLADRLAAALEQRPRLFDHLLLVTLICRFVASHLELSASVTEDLLLAGLMHDLGELHTDPALLESERRLDGAEMHYIYAHPITGHVIATAVAPDHPGAAVAVLQHQERLDGSGYPHGLRAEDLDLLSRIVAVADACAAILARFGCSQRLEALMRLSHKKYDATLIATLQRAFRDVENDAAAGAAVVPQLKAMAALLRRWDDFRAALVLVHDGDPPPELAFLFERMGDLHVMLRQFGFDADRMQVLRALVAEDETIAGELAAALNEMRWQVGDIERELLRRKDAALRALSPGRGMYLEDWLADLRRYLAAC